MVSHRSLAAVTLFAVAAAVSTPSQAQSEPARRSTPASPGGLEEIIVTARKREESILKAPVVVQAITAEQVENLRINDMYQLGAVTPNLKITVGFASVGAVASLRGLGNGMAANFIDQSVLLNVDGAALSHGAFYRGALFDVGQIEVLKGPQALFFGKSSSAGIVAVTSADPGKEWDNKVTAGAEFEADEYLVDAYVSGPLSDTVGIRVAGYYNEQQGWLRNRNPTNPNDRMPDEENYGGRITLKYDNDDNLVARLKFSTTSNENNAFDGDINQRDCTGDTTQVPAYAPYDDCKINFYVSGNGPSLPYRPDLDYSLGSPDFAVGTPSSLTRDGVGYQFTDTNSAVGTIDYAITPNLSIASVTAYSDVKAQESGRSFSPPPVNFFDLGARYEQDSWSQELRLTSDFHGWFDSWSEAFTGKTNRRRACTWAYRDSRSSRTTTSTSRRRPPRCSARSC